MDNYQNQVEIDLALSHQVVMGMVQDQVPENPAKKLITVIYPSTAALLRRIKGDHNEKPIKVLVNDLDKAEKDHPTIKTIKLCKANNDNSFCVCIATYLPTSALDLYLYHDKDSILTHTFTCFGPHSFTCFGPHS